MKKHCRSSFILGLMILLCGHMASPVYAGKNAGAGDNVLSTIKNNPCINFYYNAGDTHSVPVATCGGYGGSSASIQILLRGWAIEPAFPIVNTPFSVGIGIDPSSARVVLSPKTTVTFPYQIRFAGFRTEIYIEPVPITNEVFNGALGGDASMDLNDWFASQINIDTQLVDKTEVISASVLGSKYYPGGNDTIYLGMNGLTSSFHAANPSIYKGEPAYRLTATSVYTVQAKATWDYYQEWVTQLIGYKDVCVPGRNSEGLVECSVDTGGHYWDGHYTRKPIYDSFWGDEVYGNKQIEPVGVAIVTTDLVRWPDGTIHDHIPILIYQSQPLLQKP